MAMASDQRSKAQASMIEAAVRAAQIKAAAAMAVTSLIRSWSFRPNSEQAP